MTKRILDRLFVTFAVSGGPIAGVATAAHAGISTDHREPAVREEH